MMYIYYDTNTGKISSASNRPLVVDKDLSILETVVSTNLTELVTSYYVKDNRLVEKLELNVNQVYELRGVFNLDLDVPENTVLVGSDYEVIADSFGIELSFSNSDQDHEILLLPPHPYKNKKVNIQVWQNTL